MFSSLISSLKLTAEHVALSPCICSVRKFLIELHHQLHRSHIGNDHVDVSVQRNELREDAGKEQDKDNKRSHWYCARFVTRTNHKHQHKQSCNPLYELRQRPVFLHPEFNVEKRGACLIEPVVIELLRAVNLGNLYRLPEIVNIFKQPVIGVDISLSQVKSLEEEFPQENKQTMPTAIMISVNFAETSIA